MTQGTFSRCQGTAKLGETRPLFHVTRNVSFFNCAGMAPLLQNSVDAIAAAAAARAQPWEISAAAWFAPPDARRAAFAAGLGADADCIAAFRPRATAWRPPPSTSRCARETKSSPCTRISPRA